MQMQHAVKTVKKPVTKTLAAVFFDSFHTWQKTQTLTHIWLLSSNVKGTIIIYSQLNDPAVVTDIYQLQFYSAVMETCYLGGHTRFMLLEGLNYVFFFCFCLEACFPERDQRHISCFCFSVLPESVFLCVETVSLYEPRNKVWSNLIQHTILKQ